MVLSGKQLRRVSTLRTILLLAWPSILEQLMQSAVQYIDTAMVGTLGTQATAAVGATSTVAWMINGIVFGFSTGFLALISRSIGSGDRDRVNRASGQAVLVTLVMGLTLTAITVGLSGKVPQWMQVDPAIRQLSSTYFFIMYLPMLFRTASIMLGTVLRAAGDTKTPMKVGVGMNVINVALNFLLIFPTRPVTLLGLTFTMPGAGWGVIGAAIASAASFVWGGAVTAIVLWRHPVVSPRGAKLLPDPAILRPCFRVAFPNMCQRLCTAMGYVAFASMINSLGETATAAHTIANTVESAFYIPGFGIQTAAATLAGNAYGQRNNRRMKLLASMLIPLTVGLLALSGALLFLGAPALMGIFSESPEVVGLGSTVLRMVAVSEPFYGFSIIIEGMMMGVGKTREPFLFSVLAMWCVRILGTLVCTQLLGLGLTAAWGCMIANNLVLFCLYLRCYLRGSWNPLNAPEAAQV